MKYFLPFFISLFSFSQTHSQNLLKNSGFEEYTDCPVGLTEFLKVKYWFSPNGGTPDYFNQCYNANLSSYRSPTVGVPQNRLGSQNPKSGKGYAGIIVLDEKPQLTEYIKTRLTEPMLANQKYCVQMYVSLADYSRFSIDKIGFYFSKENINIKEWKIIDVVPQVVNQENNFINSSVKWTRVGGEYTALGGEEYLIIGNFEKTENQKKEKTKLTEKQMPPGLDDILSYYYIDEVSVSPMENNVACIESEKISASASQDTFITLENMTVEQIKTGNSIVLKNIFFETDKSKLLKESFKELNKLIFLMNKFPEMKIEINGHTDNVGEEKHNQQLSEDRAKSVIKYLIVNGVHYERLNFYGRGATMPIATNKTEEGKQTNRRVDFKIISVE